jgi:hypothetical protein
LLAVANKYFIGKPDFPHAAFQSQTNTLYVHIESDYLNSTTMIATFEPAFKELGLSIGDIDRMYQAEDRTTDETYATHKVTVETLNYTVYWDSNADNGQDLKMVVKQQPSSGNTDSSRGATDDVHGDGPGYTDPKYSSSAAQSATQSRSNAPTVTPDNPCPLTTADVQQALHAWLAPGTVTIDPRSGQYDSGWYRCFYDLPDGSFNLAGSGGTNIVASEGVEFVIDTYPYALNYKASAGVYDTEASWGGDTASEVHVSALASELSLAAADPYKHAPQDHPEIGGGLVTDGWGGFDLAGVRDNWYSADVGNVKGNAAYTDAFIELAKVLAAKG